MFTMDLSENIVLNDIHDYRKLRKDEEKALFERCGKRLERPYSVFYDSFNKVTYHKTWIDELCNINMYPVQGCMILRLSKMNAILWQEYNEERIIEDVKRR